MTVELRDLIIDIAMQAVAMADSALSSLFALSAADAPNALDVGTLLVGGGAGGAVGGGSVVGGGSSDRGFRYTGSDGTVYDRPGGTVVGDAPTGGRLVYDGVTRDSNGTPTHYHVNVPGGGSGWIPAGNTSNTRPTVPPPPRPSVVIEGGAGLANSASAQTAGSRG